MVTITVTLYYSSHWIIFLLDKPNGTLSFLNNRQINAAKSVPPRKDELYCDEDIKGPRNSEKSYAKIPKMPSDVYYNSSLSPDMIFRDTKKSKNKPLKINPWHQKTETGVPVMNFDIEIEASPAKVVKFTKKLVPLATQKDPRVINYNRTFYYCPHKEDTKLEEIVASRISSLSRALGVPRTIKDQIYSKRELIVQTQRELVAIDGKDNSFDSLFGKEAENVHKNTLNYSITPQENNKQQEADRREYNQSEARFDKPKTDETRNMARKSTEFSQGSAYLSKNSPLGKIRALNSSKNSMKNLKGSQVHNRDKLENAALYKLIDGYKDFMLRINLSFNLVVKAPEGKGATHYKYYLGKGNNGTLIRALMKQRWWWSQSDSKDPDDINFIWTQLKQNKFIESLKPKKKALSENIDTNTSTNHVTDMTAQIDLTTNLTESDTEADLREMSTSLLTQKPKRIHIHRSQTDIVGVESDNEKEGMRPPKSQANTGLRMLFTETEIGFMKRYTIHKQMPNSLEESQDMIKMREKGLVQTISEPNSVRMCNHIENSFHLGNKKALLWNMRQYYESIKDNVFNYLPLTFHIQTGTKDPEWKKFLELYERNEKEPAVTDEEGKGGNAIPKNIWIVKPGEETNRGRGINVCSELSQIKELVSEQETTSRGVQRTYLIQQYLSRPLLYNKRKFDIRCYLMISCINGIFKGNL